MAEIANLVINDKQAFDENVWQTTTDFNPKRYQTWLSESADTIQKIVNMCEENDTLQSILSHEIDIYRLGDIANLLSCLKVSVPNEKGSYFSTKFQELKKNLIDAIINHASQSGKEYIIFPDMTDISYSSSDNGWCIDQLAAIDKDGNAFFCYEASSHFEDYDFNEDSQDIICATMLLDDIMLNGLITIASELGEEKVSEMAQSFMDDVKRIIADITDYTPSGLYANYADNDGFWCFGLVSSISQSGVKICCKEIEWSNIPLDDQCNILDDMELEHLASWKIDINHDCNFNGESISIFSAYNENGTVKVEYMSNVTGEVLDSPLRQLEDDTAIIICNVIYDATGIGYDYRNI